MTIPNAPTSEVLMRMSVGDLYEYHAAVKHAAEQAALEVKAVNAVIAERFSLQMQDAYNRADKAHGTMRVDLGDGIEAKGEVSKTVSWDQSKLQAMAADMDWPTVSHFFNITFKVPEKVYDGLPPDDPRKKLFDEARTVKYGDGKITLEKKGE